MKKVVVLGSTGSVGKQALETLQSPDYQVTGLACFSNESLLREQMAAICCGMGACIRSQATDLYTGEDAFLSLVKNAEYDILIAAASGLTSLKAVLYALQDGKRVALANKEIAVCAGGMLYKYGEREQIIPVDSEHSAIFQCLHCGKEISSITLTCSGGALRDMPLEKLNTATAKDCLAHPNWKMGNKITIDCATLANKAFEVIEAARLFEIPISSVKVLKHAQSYVHGFVTFADGSIIAQACAPDMRLPIRYAITYPERRTGDPATLDLTGKTLTFEPIDNQRYPMFSTIVDACRENEGICAFLSGADEAAVNRFLQGHISYRGLHTIIRKAASYVAPKHIKTAEEAIGLYNAGYKLALYQKV